MQPRTDVEMAAPTAQRVFKMLLSIRQIKDVMPGTVCVYPTGHYGDHAAPRTRAVRSFGQRSVALGGGGTPGSVGHTTCVNTSGFTSVLRRYSR